MEETETTNLAEDVNASEAEVENEVQEQPEQLLDDEGNPIEDQAETEEEEFEEIERDGKKAKVPAWLKPELMMQADYTRKTQELAEVRKAVEAERTAFQQASQQEITAQGNLVAIDSQLAQYSKVDWNAFHDSDPFEAQKAFTQYQLLRDARTQTETHLGRLQQERTVNEQRAAAKRLEEGAAEIAKAIPEWSPTHAAKLVEAGQKHFGFSKGDLDGIDDPKLVIALNAAVKWFEHEAQTKKAKSIVKAQEVTPAAKVGRSSAPPTGLDDRLSNDEWQRRREAQLRKRG